MWTLGRYGFSCMQPCEIMNKVITRHEVGKGTEQAAYLLRCGVESSCVRGRGADVKEIIKP